MESVEVIQSAIEEIKKEVKTIESNVAIIQGIIQDFPNEESWKLAANLNRDSPSNHIWNTRFEYLNYTLSQLKEDKLIQSKEKVALKERLLFKEQQLMLSYNDNRQKIQKVTDGPNGKIFEMQHEVIFKFEDIFGTDISFPPLVINEVVDLTNFQNALSEFGSISLGKIFVREEYVIALEKWEASEGGLLLMGSPGIGKSTFGRLILCLLISRGEKVIYWPHEESPIMFDGKIVKIMKTNFLGKLDDAVVIYDGRKGFQSMSADKNVKKVLIIHSPSADINNSAKSSNLTDSNCWIMNASSYEECLKIHEQCQWKISLEALRENFLLCGGLLRYLQYDTKKLIKHVNDGCKKVAEINFSSIVRCNYLPEDSEKLSHRVLHLRRIDDVETQLEFGSEYIENLIINEKGRDGNLALLELANSIDINGSLRGDIFENRMHSYLSENFTLDLNIKTLFPIESKPLTTVVSKMNILMRQKKTFQKLSDVSEVIIDTYYYPKDKRICLKSIDSFFLTYLNGNLTLVLVQMTVAESHPVKRKGLMDIIDITKKDHESFDSLLVFLLPPVVFNKWTSKQKVLNVDGKESKTALCDQEAWCLHKCNGSDVWNT